MEAAPWGAGAEPEKAEPIWNAPRLWTIPGRKSTRSIQRSGSRTLQLLGVVVVAQLRLQLFDAGVSPGQVGRHLGEHGRGDLLVVAQQRLRLHSVVQALSSGTGRRRSGRR